MEHKLQIDVIPGYQIPATEWTEARCIEPSLILSCPCGWAIDCPSDRTDLITDYFDAHDRKRTRAG